MTECHTLLISDIHIGSKICRTEKVIELLETASFKTLIINGDLFDSKVTKAFSKDHWYLISILADLARKKDVILVGGNHGRELDNIVKNMGVEIKDDYLFTIGTKRILCLHGDQFDPFVTHVPMTSRIFANIFYNLQKLDGQDQESAMIVKKFSKRLLGITSGRQKNLATKHAAHKKADIIICSHTHIPHMGTKNGILYINSGSFCEHPCTFVAIDKNGKARLEKI